MPRTSSARSRSINGTERSEQRRAAIRALQHRRKARFAAGLPPIEKPPTNRSFWFVLLLIVAVSLSGPLWLPYTGVTLPASVLVITSIKIASLLVTCYWLATANFQHLHCCVVSGDSADRAAAMGA